MSEWYVRIPIAGSASFVVEASSEKTAIAAARQQIEDGSEPEVEWEYLDRICAGNVCYAPLWDIEAEPA